MAPDQLSGAREEERSLRAGSVPVAVTFRGTRSRAAVVLGDARRKPDRGTHLVRRLAHSQSHEAGGLRKKQHAIQAGDRPARPPR